MEEAMKRIDRLAGATINQIEVGRGGTIHLYLRSASGDTVWEWNPMVIQIPKEPKKRKPKR
jgi:hypothetical protein